VYQRFCFYVSPSAHFFIIQSLFCFGKKYFAWKHNKCDKFISCKVIFAMRSDMRESIGSRLKTFRLSKKVTQKDMASALGCSEITYNRYEREATLPRTEDLSFLYNMGCNLNWLITGEGTMDDEQKSDKDLLATINKITAVMETQANIIDKQTDTIKILAARDTK
jgi:transcriptional regulator with XRE-family HTH domain